MRSSYRAALLLVIFSLHVLQPSLVLAGDLGDLFKNWRFHRQETQRPVGTWQRSEPLTYQVTRDSRPDVKLMHVEQARDSLKTASKHLEMINRHVKEWGHAAASQFFLFPDQRETGGDQIGTPFGIGNSTSLNLEGMSEKVRKSLQGAVSILREDATAVGGKLAVGNDELLGVAQTNEILKQQAIQDRINAQAAIQQRENEASILQAQRALDNFRDGTSNPPPTPTGFPSPLQTPGTSNITQSTIKTVDADNKLIEVTPPNPLLPANTEAGIDKTNANSGFGPLDNPFANSNFKAQGNLLSRTSPADNNDPPTDVKSLGLSLSESDVLKIASSTVVTGKLLQTMSDPKGYSSDKQVFMAVTEVSVAPGTFTRRGYACEVHLRPQYATQRRCDDCAQGKNAIEQHPHGPQIFAAFPLADAQTLDLVFGDRHQFQLMLDIAAKAVTAGQTVTANALFNRIERMQRDVATRTPLPVIVPNSDGTMVSYRFEPSLRAVANPGSKASQPDLVLPPMSIPALVVLVCDKKDLHKYPYLRMESSARWVPLEFRHWLKTWTVDWMWRGRRFTQTEPIDERFEMADRMDWVHYYLNQARPWCASTTSNDHHSFREIETRLATIEPLIGHTSLETRLPPALPEITSITEGEINLEQDSPEIVLEGGGFLRSSNGTREDVVRRASINNRPISHVSCDNQVKLLLGKNAKEWLNTDFATVKLDTISGEVSWSDIPVRKAKAKTLFHILEVAPSKVEPENASGTLKAGTNIAVVCSAPLDRGTVITVDGIVLEGGHVQQNVAFGKVPMNSAIGKGSKSVVIISGDNVATLSNAIIIGSAAEPVKTPEVLFPRKTSPYRIANSGTIAVHGANFKNQDNASPPVFQDAILQIIAEIKGGSAKVLIDPAKLTFDLKPTGEYQRDRFTLPMPSAEAWKKMAITKDDKPVDIKGELEIGLKFIWKNHSSGAVNEIDNVISLITTF